VKLCFSPTSPYVRKVRACAITREIDGLIELVPTDANASPPEFVAINPLSKVPALVTDDGVALFDSPVICEYLDGIGDGRPMFPPRAWRRALAGAEVAGDGRRHSRCVGAAAD
jgi:glutathione S-transferase